MNQKIKTLLCVLTFIPFYFFIYAFLHEAGHALVILAYGGTIDNFVFWNFNAHVSSSGGAFTSFGMALNTIAGMLLPTIIGVIAISLYRPNKKSAGYHICYFTTLFGLLGSMSVWVAIPIISLFNLPPRDDVTNFLNLTRYHPLIVSISALFFVGAFVVFAHAKGLLSKTNLQKIYRSFKSNNENIIAKNNGNRKNKILFTALGLLVISAATLYSANYITYYPPGVFNTSGVITNVLEERSWESTLAIEDSRIYSFDIEIKAYGLITAFCVIDESGEYISQNQAEGFMPSIISFGLDEGIYTLSMMFLTDYEAVADYFVKTGFGELDPKEIQYINEAFSRDNTSYAVEYFISVR
ncbi:MAG: M50 family metallopeptidase [Lachnospiraceae bacterium]|nr:M50 family metallopeptidase [Lachnospiraceae bacterium]